MKVNQLEQCIVAAKNGGGATSPATMTEYMCTSEDLHWLLMVTINALAPPNIQPLNIIRLSIDSKSDPTQTQAALALCDASQESIDPVVRLVIVILKLVNMEKVLLQSGSGDLISPQVSLTLTTFVNRFMHYYLISSENEDEDGEMSLTFNACFGIDSPSSKQLVEFFFDHLLAKFLGLSSEQELLTKSSEGVATFCKLRERWPTLQASPSLRLLLEHFSNNQLANVGGSVRINMYTVFTTVYRNDLSIVIDPLKRSYEKFSQQLVAGVGLNVLQEQFMQIIECTHGIVDATNDLIFRQLWPQYLLHLYNDLPRVVSKLHAYSSVVQSILQLVFNLNLAVAHQLSEAESIEFYNTIVNILTEYAKHNVNKFTADSNRLEELQEEFVWILKFLNELSSRDILFLFRYDDNSSLNTIVSKVVLTCLNIILPLMCDELLQDEKLCRLYYKLLESIASEPEQFKFFPVRLFESFLNSVNYIFKVTK